jgi:UDP-3-O-[3-hydroxymyristoyl] N-acetylglucosamine deacetylase
MDKVVDTRLATTIGNESFRISTTEHLMAALRAFGVDNANIELDSAEVPIMDGSAAPFFQMLKNTGKKKQSGLRKVLRITKPISYRDGNSLMTISPYNSFKITGEICFDDTLINSQKFSVELSAPNFESELAKARTFGYVEQVEELWANGLALGGTLDNVIAIHWNRKSVLNEDGLRYKDEFIRHKVLDIVGDLALLGCPVLGHVQAFKAGHTQHLGLMKKIAESPECWDFLSMKGNGTASHVNGVRIGAQIAKGVLMPFFNIDSASAATPA